MCGDALKLSFFTAEKLSLFFKIVLFVNKKWKVRSTKVKRLNFKAFRVNMKPTGPLQVHKGQGKKKKTSETL